MASADKTVFSQFKKVRSIHRGFYKWKSMDDCDNQIKFILQKELGIILCLFSCTLHLALVAPLLEKADLRRCLNQRPNLKKCMVYFMAYGTLCRSWLSPYAHSRVDSNKDGIHESKISLRFKGMEGEVQSLSI